MRDEGFTDPMAVETSCASSVEDSLQARVSFLNERQLPAVIEALPGERLETVLGERQALAPILRQHGAILFRGFALTTAEQFHSAAALAFDNGLRTYIGGVSPRGQVTAGVYESTRFPAHLRIPQHNEMSYLPEPPRALAFFCETPPGSGGETPLADSRLIYKLIPAQVREAFIARGITYHRYLYGPRWNLYDRTRNRISNLHTSWMAAFATDDPAADGRAAVERACTESGSSVRWDREEGASISNTLAAVRTHPESGEELWFNQTVTFLSSPRSTGFWPWLLYRMAYRYPFRRPFHATFGDGTPITHRQLDAVHDAIEEATIRFPWQQGDLLIVDNFLVTHGRMPFKGKRRILVAIH